MQRSSSSTWTIPSWLRLVVAGSLLLEIAMTFMVIMAQNGSTPTPVAAMASQLHDLLAIFGSGHVTELKAQVSVLQETQLFVWETVQVGEVDAETNFERNERGVRCGRSVSRELELWGTTDDGFHGAGGLLHLQAWVC